MDLRDLHRAPAGRVVRRPARQVARRTEDLGFDAFFRSDHYLSMGQGAGGTGEPGPTDAWMTLAGLARETSRIRLGTLVTRRPSGCPAPLAIRRPRSTPMSRRPGRARPRHRVVRGRARGVRHPVPAAAGTLRPAGGAAADRHRAVGDPGGPAFSFDGSHYELADSPALPKPVQWPLPVIVGGYGKRRTPALAARSRPSSTWASAGGGGGRPGRRCARGVCRDRAATRRA